MSNLTEEQLVQACANIGYDLTCGTCAELFYTGGSSGNPHDETCSTTEVTKKGASVLVEMLEIASLKGEI